MVGTFFVLLNNIHPFYNGNGRAYNKILFIASFNLGL